MRTDKSLVLEKDGSPTIFLWGANKENEIIQKYAQNVQIQEKYLELMNAVYAIVYCILQAKEPDAADIEIIKKSFFHKSKLVNEIAGKYIVQLTHYSLVFANMLNELSRDKQSTIRLRVAQSLFGVFPPHNQTNKILINALSDCSKRVRLFAIERIMFYNLTDLLPTLKEKTFNESEGKLKEMMVNAINLL